MTHNELLNEADMLKGNIARMMVTKELDELLTMFEVAETRLETIYQERCKELDDEIKVGDEVYHLDRTNPRVVTSVQEAENGYIAVQMTQNGKWTTNMTHSLKKTGRHFSQINEVLKQIRGEER